MVSRLILSKLDPQPITQESFVCISKEAQWVAQCLFSVSSSRSIPLMTLAVAVFLASSRVNINILVVLVKKFV